VSLILSVDLAAKLSAVILRRAGGGAGDGIVTEFDSRDKTPLRFLQEIAIYAKDADMVIVEDVPYGISNQSMIKPVVRLQGALCAYLTAKGCLDKTLFMSPSVWMRDYPGTQTATTKGLSKSASDKERIETARTHAERLGYTPPDLVSEYVATLPEGKKVLKKNTAILEKSMTDYVSAFLMAEFSRAFTFEELLAKPGVSLATL